MKQKKVCLLGSSGVGKTSLIRRFVEGIFDEKYLTTIGVKIDKKHVKCQSEEIQLMLWDIEGSDRYALFQQRYLRGSSAYIIVVDQSRSNSLEEGIDIQTIAKQVVDCPAILAINKSDLDTHWHWNDSHLVSFKDKFSATFSTSAKSGQNVEEMFNYLAELLIKDDNG